MNHGYSVLGFIVIVILYVSIGLMAAGAEQIFYAMFLIMIALFYLAFTAYFGVATAWRLELAAVAAFFALALLGVRLPFALIVAYPLHGVDLLHEFQAHGIHGGFDPGQLTAIPLAYGIFCAVFDFSMGAYFYTQRLEWRASWKPVWQP